jgi:hypothetical protein
MSFADESLPVEVVGWRELAPGPSCQLLKHRHQERQKRLREWVYMNGLENDDSIQHLVNLNNFIIHRLFLDQAVWDEELIEIHLRAPLPTQGLSWSGVGDLMDQFFYLKGLGIEWMGQAINFPENVQWSLVKGQIEIKYLIYRSQLCSQEEPFAELKWLEEGKEDFSDYFE